MRYFAGSDIHLAISILFLSESKVLNTKCFQNFSVCNHFFLFFFFLYGVLKPSDSSVDKGLATILDRLNITSSSVFCCFFFL